MRLARQANGSQNKPVAVFMVVVLLASAAIAVVNAPSARASCPGLKAGRWSGTWTSTSFPLAGGNLSAVLRTDGTSVSGTLRLTGSALSSAPISGQLSCTTINFGVAGGLATFSGLVAPDGQSAAGTYSAPVANDAGTWSMSPAGSGYIALGDSYSAGEGVPAFQSSTDTWSNRCHRSYGAYPRLLENLRLAGDTRIPANTEHWACSGAVIANVVAGQYDEPAQVDHVGAATALVTISIGGNDVGFVPLLSACVTDNVLWGDAVSKCATLQVPNTFDDKSATVSLNQYFMRRLRGLQTGWPGACRSGGDAGFCLAPPLTSLYSQIAEAAPAAKIIVLGYPHLFSTKPSTLGCSIGSGARLSARNMRWANNKVDQLNSFTAKKVEQARASGMNIVYVDPRPAFDDTDGGASAGGHGICTPTPWMTGLIVDWGQWGGSIFGIADVRPWSFHPNSEGQGAFAALVASKL